jgi:hypothetical protein
MQTPDPASVLLRQRCVFADIDSVLDGQPPDEGDDLPTLARYHRREWLTGPLLTLGRQLVRPPEDDAPRSDAPRRIAAYLLRLAHQVVVAERAVEATSDGLDDPDEPSEQVGARVSELEWEIEWARESSVEDRRELKAALRAVAGPLLPRTHDEMYAWVLDHTSPSPEPATGVTSKRGVKGKHIDARMFSVLIECPESRQWTAQQWAKFFKCSDGTIKGTKTWKERVEVIREHDRREAAEGMDCSRVRPSGRQKSGHKPA